MCKEADADPLQAAGGARIAEHAMEVVRPTLAESDPL
jgi:hypothetical protein